MASGKIHNVVDLAVSAIDWGGLGGDPMAAVVALRLRTDIGPTWLVIRELYETRITLQETIQQLRKWQEEFRIVRTWADHSQPLAVEALIAAGLPALMNKTRDIEFGVRTLYGLIKAKRFRVDAKYCPNLIQELRRYSWRLDRSGTPKGKLPEDRSNDLLDCCRYLCTGEGEVPPEEQIDPIPPEEQPTIFRGTDGLLHDNIEATVARRKKDEDDAPFSGWWDEIVDAEDPEDQADEFRQIAHHLGMPWRG